MVTNSVLVVDDEVRSQEAMRRSLDEEFRVLTAASADEARNVLERDFADVILCDQRMPGTTGVQFLKEARSRWPDTVRIIISGYTDTEDIIAGINDAGIYQYVLKPWQPESLLLTVRGAAQLARLQRDNHQLELEMRHAEPVLRQQVDGKRAAVRRRYDFANLVRGPGSPIGSLCELVTKVAPYDISVMITGESGTGKELLARSIHYASARGEKAFVVENCAALPEQLLESELFGHKRGAFTGAYEDRIGLFQQADGGTIFLDEIADTSPAFQVKLLRVLQEGEIRPVGSPRTVRVDVRVIAATNRNIEAEVRAGRFREDLYYRLTTFSVHLPALRERPMDVAPIAHHILDQASRALKKPAAGFTQEAIECLCAYRWPGNVRELQNEIYRMLALASSERLGADLISPRVLHAADEAEESDLRLVGGLDGNLKERLDALEARIIKETLVRHRWNKTRAAGELGLSRVGLRAKLGRYGLEK